MLSSSKTDKFLMGFQLKLLALWFFLVLTLSLCHGNNVTVKVVGVIHCTDCITNQTTSNINISIHCKSGNHETKTQANGVVDKEGNFNVTLSADITNDGKSIGSCFAKLQSASSPNPCPIQSAQTAAVKLLSIEENAVEAQNKPTVIKFSPITCQSAFFWPFPNVTFFPFLSPPPQKPPAEYSPPPFEALTPLSPPVQPPAPPEVDPTTPPALAPKLPNLPPVPSPSHEPIPPPTPKRRSAAPPTPKRRSAAPPPRAFHQSPSVPPTPSISPTSPPPHAFHRTPSMLPPPTLSPTSPPPETFHRTPSVPPISVLPLTPPPQKQPSPKKRRAPATPVSAPAPPPELENPISSPPNARKPSPIPRAPPVPKLPPFPTVPRKYFNSPKSRSQPPSSS